MLTACSYTSVLGCPKWGKNFNGLPLIPLLCWPCLYSDMEIVLGRLSQYSTSKTYFQILKIVIFHISETSSNEERSGESKTSYHPKNGDLYQKLKNVPYSFSKAL